MVLIASGVACLAMATIPLPPSAAEPSESVSLDLYAGIQVTLTDPDPNGQQRLRIRFTEEQIELADWIRLGSHFLNEPIFVDPEILDNQLDVKGGWISMSPENFGATFDRVLRQIGLARQKIGVTTCILYIPRTRNRPRRYSHTWFPFEETPFHTSFGLWSGLVEAERHLDSTEDQPSEENENTDRPNRVREKLRALQTSRSALMKRIAATANAIVAELHSESESDSPAYRLPESVAPMLMIDVNPPGTDDEASTNDESAPILHLIAGAIEASPSDENGEVRGLVTATGTSWLPDGASLAFLESTLALSFHRRFETSNGAEIHHALDAPPPGALDDVPAVAIAELHEWRGRFSPIRCRFTSDVLPTDLLATAIAHGSPPSNWRELEVIDGAIHVLMEGDRAWRLERALRDSENWLKD